MLTRASSAVQEAVAVCKKSEKMENSLKVLVLHTLARVLSTKFKEDPYEDGARMTVAARYAELAVELDERILPMKNDDCEYCTARTDRCIWRTWRTLDGLVVPRHY